MFIFYPPLLFFVLKFRILLTLSRIIVIILIGIITALTSRKWRFSRSRFLIANSRFLNSCSYSNSYYANCQ
nr:MAG TPA: hypothetical protein [Caudoviricetes sp.]